MRTTVCILVVALTLPGLTGASPPASPQERPRQSATRDGPCVVPDVIGLDQAAARDALARAGLRPGHVATRSADAPAGVVVGQQPPACGDRPANASVDLFISEGSRTTDAPRSPERSGGSTIGDLAVPIGIGVGVAVLGEILSRRGSTTDVPDLLRRSVADGEARLARAHLQLGETVSTGSFDAPAGTIIEQSPAAGTRVPRGSVVHVQVSSGRPMTDVPDITDTPWLEAEARIEGAGLHAVITERDHGETTDLIVTSQSPEAGTRVVVGAAVGVVLRVPARPQPPADPPPPVVGDRQDDPPPAASRPPAVVPDPTDTPARPSPGTQAPTDDVPSVTTPPASSSSTVDAAGGVPPPQVQAPPAVAPAPADAPPTSAAPPLVLTLLPSGRWLWFLFLLLAMLALWTRGHAPGRTNAPPPVSPAARVTVVPRLDDGQQTMGGGRSRTIELALHLDAGTQTLESNTTQSNREGARP